MPYKSKAQAAYFNIHKAELEHSGVDVEEWNQASKGKKLPARAKPKKTRSHKNGQISERQEARREQKYGGKDDMNIPGATA